MAVQKKPAQAVSERADDSRRTALHGANRLRTALDRDAPLRAVVALRSSLSEETVELLDRVQALGLSVRRVSRREMRRISGITEVPEVIGLCGPDPAGSLSEMLAAEGPVWLLTQTMYPGNAGLTIRSAEVSGAAGVCLDAPFDRTGRRECLRAAMRVDRYFPVFFGAALDVIEAAKASGRQVIAVEHGGERAPWEIDLTVPVLIIVGGEVGGIPAAQLERADYVTRIPTGGFVSSYNLQAAMAVVMAEWLRQTTAPATAPIGR